MDSLARALEQDPDGLQSGWLAASWADPARFWSALLQVSAGAGMRAPKSVLAEGYDLYHDAVVRHIVKSAGPGGQAERVAFRWYEPPRGWQALPYEELHHRCGLQARTWAERGVEPGMIVAVILPFGIDYVVAVLTALRLGACVSAMPPMGDRYMARRLEVLQPGHIVTDRARAGMLTDFADRVDFILTDAGSARTTPQAGYDRSHTYAAGDPCALLFSPLRALSALPQPLTCDDAYLHALRDGLLAFGLRPGDHFAAPGFHALQFQPCLVLSVLLAGATFVHLPMTALAREPDRLMDWPLRSIGISAALRDLLLDAGPRGKPAWSHWFTNPEEPIDWDGWRELMDAYDLARVPRSNAIIEAAGGGSLLVSGRSTGTRRLDAMNHVRPAPGVPWALFDSNQSGQEAAGNVGVFGQVRDEPVFTHVVMARLDARRLRLAGEHLYVKSPEPRRAGWLYPQDEVEEAVQALPGVDAASSVILPSGGQARIVLLVFTGHSKTKAKAEADTKTDAKAKAGASAAGNTMQAGDIARVIAARVGRELVPDRIELVPLMARRLDDGTVDHVWCRNQYRGGLLFRKARMPMFQHLTALRHIATTEGPRT